MSPKPDQEVSKNSSPEDATTQADQVLSSSLGQTLFNAYADLVDTQSTFNLMDTNADGFLGKVELVDSLGKNPRARHMLENISDIEEASNDEFGDESLGISQRDLEEKFKQEIEAHVGAVGARSTEDVDVRSRTEMSDASIKSMSIVDRARGLTFEYKDGGTRLERIESDVASLGDHDKELESVLGPDLFNAYQDYQDGGENGAFDDIDFNTDGHLDEKELNDFLILSNDTTNPDVLRQREAADHMLKNFDQIQNAGDDDWGFERNGITLNDLSQSLIDLAVETDVAGNLEFRLQNGMPGALERDDSSATFRDHYSDVLATKSEDTTMITISDPVRRSGTSIYDWFGSIKVNTNVDLSEPH